MKTNEVSMGTEDKQKDDLEQRAMVFTPVSNGTSTSSEHEKTQRKQSKDTVTETKRIDVKTDEKDAMSVESMTSMPQDSGKKTLKKWVKVLIGIFAVLLCTSAVLFGTSWGRGKVKKIAIYLATEYAYSKMDYDDGENVVVQDPVVDIDSTKVEDSDSLDIIWGNSGYDGSGRHDEKVINVLLLGEEAIGSGSSRGRTDMIMIATMNVENKTLKLTSIMRDTLVQLPDYNGKSYQDNKLNAAYEIGGIQYLYETIARNFDIALDGYALVGFEDFENIINAIGGVKVTLSEKEARYLNRTNYISNPAYRNVVPGTQMLNGNQALGFCRVRHVPTVDDQHYDYGRTSRQRVVLNAIFDQVKSKGMTQLILLMNELLEYVTTDITKEQFRNYLEIGLTLDISDIDNCRIPADHTFEEGYERGMSVLIPDLDANIKILHSFIFGDILEDGLNDGIILDGMDHLNAIEEKKRFELEQQQE